MRTTVTIDDKLWATAVEYTGITERSALLREAFKELIDREKRRRRRLLLSPKAGASEPVEE